MKLIDYFINNINKYYKHLSNNIIDNISKISLNESSHMNLYGINEGLKEYYAYYIINQLTNRELNIKDLRLTKCFLNHKSNIIEFNVHINTAFFEFDLNNKANYDKHIISKYLNDIVKVKNYKYDRHIVLFKNFDKLSFGAFMCLRRMMEYYSPNVLFITISKNLSKVPDAIISRCFNIRCPIIENTNLNNFVKVFLKDINIETYSAKDINKLTKSCDYDFNKILLKLDIDNYFTNITNKNLSTIENIEDLEEHIAETMDLDKDPIKYIDYLDTKIKKHLSYLKRTKKIITVLEKNREFIYTITYFNYDNQLILEKFLKIILTKYSDIIKYDKIIKLTADTDMNILKSSRDIYHYEQYLLNIYKMFHNI